MSHNASLGSPPHVTAISPTIISAAGATTITITGGNLSPSCQLDIGALGTVTGPGVYTAISNSEGELAFPITALAPPGSPTARVCTLSNGGMVSTGATVSINHSAFVWNPEELVKTAADGWFSPAGMRGATYPTPIADGANIVGWHPNGATSGLSKLYYGTATYQGIYTAAHAGWGSSTNWPGSAIGSGGASMFFSDNDGTWDRASGDDYTMALVVSPTSVANWGSAYIRWTGTTGGSSSDYTDFIFLTGDSYSSAPVGPGDLASNSRDTGTWAHHNSSINLSAGGTHIFAIRRVGSAVSIYLNSATAVQTYSPGSNTSVAHYGMIDHRQSILAEAVFLKYGASDAEMVELVDYWDEKYGS